MSNPQIYRRGVTLVEVMFAMGVALIGLVGLISVLPIAGKRTQDAINLNDGSALAHAIYDELKTRGILSQRRWRVRNDFSVGIRPSTTTLNPERTKVVPDGKGGTMVVDASDVLDNATSWCIDPLFVSSTSSALLEPNGYYYGYDDSSGNGYRRLLFPYYRAEHNPLYDPSVHSNNRSTSDENWWTPTVAGTNTMSHTGTVSNSPFGSRMIRVGLEGSSSTFQRGIESEFIVDDRDGIATISPKDRTLSSTLQGQVAIPGGMDLGKSLSDGSLSWIATVSPLPGTDFASVAVVILRDRDRGFTTYQNTALSAAPTPKDNSVDERLAYVTYASGFSGGAGGTVHIVGAQNTSSEISSNDWVMLSRRIYPASALSYDIHRWYRVVSASGKATEIVVTDPISSTQRTVWQHKLFLDGPDWAFGFATPGAVDATVLDNTYVTLMKDVVAVAQNVVKLE